MSLADGTAPMTYGLFVAAAEKGVTQALELSDPGNIPLYSSGGHAFYYHTKESAKVKVVELAIPGSSAT